MNIYRSTYRSRAASLIFAYLSGRTKDDKQLLYQGLVGEPGQQSLVFCSDRQLKLVLSSDVVASDATYKITPRLHGSLQVMIVAVFAYGHVRTKVSHHISLQRRNVLEASNSNGLFSPSVNL